MRFLSKTFLLFLLGKAAFAQQPMWLDETKTNENRMPMHASFVAYPNTAAALKDDWTASSFYTSLNGDWKFLWVKKPADLPAHFEKPTFNDKTWKNFKVPANWEMNGYGYPIYVNIGWEFQDIMPKPFNPPMVPLSYDPTGVYRREVMISALKPGEQMVLHIGAAKSNLQVWVNGKYVGYSEDSKLAADFDISRYLKAGKNLIVLKVMRWCDGTYLEGQDFWRLGGISRDCYLIRYNPVHVFDLKLTTALDDDLQNADMQTKVILAAPAPKGTHAEVELSRGGKIIAKKSISFDGPNAIAAIHVNKPELWSAEAPNLYKVMVKLYSPSGKLLEVIPNDLGFRKVEIKNGNLFVNNQPVLIKGVNRHEVDPVAGQVISKASMLKDVQLMKQFNINAVRTCHYPDDEYWYKLCDRYGLYVVDEANIESHGMGFGERSLAKQPSWEKAHVERVQRTYERDKNITSIIIWSTGNEAGNGVNFYAAYKWLKATDPSRPIQYEGAVSNRKTYATDFNTDIDNPMYPSPESMVRYAKNNPEPKKPFIMVEYAHAMGNSVGNFNDYWNIIRNDQRHFQGGFIWDFVDQGLLKKNAQGKYIYAYGGDYGPANVPSDNNFLCNGLFYPNRHPNPHAWEVKNIYKDIWATLIDNKTVKVFNENFFRPLSYAYATWDIVVNGQKVKSGVISTLSAGPHQSEVINLPLPAQYTGETYLNITYLQKQNALLVPQGHIIGEDQIYLGGTYTNDIAVTGAGNITVKDDNAQCRLTSARMDIVFNKATGFLTTYKVNGTDYIAQGFALRPNFWRAPTDNDMGANLQLQLKDWKAVTEQPELKHFSVEQKNDVVTVATRFKLGAVHAELNVNYTINANGEIAVKQDLMADTLLYNKMLMRYGMKMVLPAGYEHIKYYGRGPLENYQDRQDAAPVDVYSQTVAEQFYPYIRPQETGNKTDIRWFDITRTDGTGLDIRSDQLLSMSALHYFDSDLDDGDKKDQRHPGDLTARAQTQLNIDMAQMGVGGINSWGELPLPKYFITYKNQGYQFKLTPIRKK